MGIRPPVFGPWNRNIFHFRWTASIRDKAFKHSVLKKSGTDRPHQPMCRVPGKGLFRYKTTKNPAEVNCRACLKKMALQIAGEEVWRRKIIMSYAYRRVTSDG